MAEKVCKHCLGPVDGETAVTESVNGEAAVFCCPACRSIYHLIRDEGLERFYSEREGWQPGKPETVRPSPEAFEVKTADGAAEVDISISGLRCSSCVWLIEKFLARIDGVISARVNYATHRAKIRWQAGSTGLETILTRIASLGYRPEPFVIGAGEEGLERERKILLIRLATAGFFSFQVMLLSIVLYEGYFRGIDPETKRAFGFVLWGLSTPVVFYAGYPFIRNTLQGLKVWAVSMDTLVFLGSMSAYLYSVFALSRGREVYFDTAAMIITLILLGRYLETGARRQASAAITALMGLQPPTARAVRKTGNGNHKSDMVPVATLRPGDLIEVLPGDTIPFDCVVKEGESEVDESMLTGEPLPVLKEAGSEVFSGTSNQAGRLLLTIKRTGAETVLSAIIQAVEEAQAAKAPVERLADRVTAWFIPAVLFIAAATYVFWSLSGAETTNALMNGISVLVIACPCALGLATPMAILAGSSRASSQGLLIRGGDILENLAGLDTVALDKTGTLTTGEPVLTNIKVYQDKEEALKTAASLEQYSEHTIARAIRNAAGSETLYQVHNFKAVAGKGVYGTINGRETVLGNVSFLLGQGIKLNRIQEEDLQELESTGGSVVGLAAGKTLLGWLVISDSLRPEAPAVVGSLKRSNYKVILLTGDGKIAARHAALAAGIAEKDIYAQATPLQKADVIRDLQSGGQRVLMVGDGINDGPALAEAEAGAAMGRATDVAVKSAGVVLMRSDLELIPQLLDISRRSYRTIKQNLFWAFTYNIVAVPLAAAGKIHPIISAGLMAASSLLVIGNSLRLRR